MEQDHEEYGRQSLDNRYFEPEYDDDSWGYFEDEDEEYDE